MMDVTISEAFASMEAVLPKAWSPPPQYFFRNQHAYDRGENWNYRRRHESPQSRTYSRGSRNISRSPNREMFPEKQRETMFQSFQKGTAPEQRTVTPEVPTDVSAFAEMCAMKI